jgi:YspA, cpYpsA-related SLOG family
MRILVCGGRDYALIEDVFEYDKEGKLIRRTPKINKGYRQYQHVLDTLNNIARTYSKEYNPTDNWLPVDITIISGMAKGADSAAADWAIINYAQLEEYPANWKTHGKSAGFIRNRQMLEEGKPDMVVAFPGGKGTAMMVDIAKKAGVPVVEIKDPPHIASEFPG